jgi:triacylglycerol lipase
MAIARRRLPREHRAHPGISIWTETLFGIDYLLLHSSPVYYGYGVPRGDGSAVVVIPGFLGSDLFGRTLHSWLRSIGYRPYESGIGLNAQCPNLLVNERLIKTVKRAAADTGRKVHLIGHSLGGMLAHAVAVHSPDDIASVITLGSPVRGIVAQKHVFKIVDIVRSSILQEHGDRVEAACYTAHCDCKFSKSMDRKIHRSVSRTAIYTRDDGIVDWRYCLTDDPSENFEVSGTHLGLVFNQSVYKIIAHRLQEATIKTSGARRVVRCVSRQNRNGHSRRPASVE